MYKRGFTLIEILIVVAIMSIVIVPTYKSFSFSSNSFEKGIARNAALQTGQHIINVLRADLSVASLKFSEYFKESESSYHKVSIHDILKSTESGYTKTYEFYTFVEPGESGNEFVRTLNKVKYVFDGNEDKQTLTRTIYYNGAAASIHGPERTTIIGKNIQRFELLATLGDSHGFRRSFFRPFFQIVETSKSKTEPAIREFMTTIIPETFNSILTFEGYNRNHNTDPK